MEAQQGCLTPLTLKRPTDLIDRVRCGRCRYCRIRRKSSWVGRMRLEQQVAAASRFLTLTYEDDPGELQVDDLQKFLKRYRHHYGPFRYYAVGEYGEKSGRGHWHLIIFGHPPETIGHWKTNKAWDHGFSFDGTAGPESIGYVAGYVLKPASRHLQRPIPYMSRKPAIGALRIEEMARMAARTVMEVWPSYYTIGGRRYPLIDGGLRIFKRAYLNAGGTPPYEMCPEERDFYAKSAIFTGSLRSVRRTARIHHERDNGVYRYGTKNASKKKV